jgi:hypothetical protein
MLLAPRLRKAVLLLHVAGSVGLPGAIASFLALAIVAVSSGNVLAVRGAYLSMQVVALALVVPLAFAALGSGLLISLGTRWGLFRHWWVVVKLLLTASSVLVLLLKLGLINQGARIAMATPALAADLGQVGLQLVVHAAGGLLTLCLALVLSIYKPHGVTRFTSGRRMNERPLSS